MKPVSIRATAAILIALPLLSCDQQARRPRPAPKNVIVVMVDTLRADHMSAYGYERETTPFIERFASQGFVFEHARSQASCTFPSVNSLLTSRNPAIFTRQEEGQLGIPDEYPSIAEVLKEHGYRTIAVSASPIVRASPSEFNPIGGFDRGYDTFVEDTLWLPGGQVNRAIARELDTLEEPFFLYAHYMDPHGPYRPPERYEKRFAGEYDGHEFIRRGNPVPIGEMLYKNGRHFDITDRDIQHLVDLYDDEIRYFDGVFRRLIKNLEDRDLLDNTLIIISSDHGEEFLEHGHIKHCRGVWDTVTRVPLIFRFPGVEGGQRFGSAVQNLDIVPTILDYLEIEPEGLNLEGTSLLPVLEGDGPSREFAFADQRAYRSADDGRFQLILNGENGVVTLYDLISDPLEQHDLFRSDHPELARLSDALNMWLTDTGQLMRFDEEIAAAKKKEEELRALGYLE
ncbi:MAG: sulfatase [Acidobacteriota bacterium]|jgi:arylsulfatase|nr:sulfatase [Acidobacteriota bacterium]